MPLAFSRAAAKRTPNAAQLTHRNIFSNTRSFSQVVALSSKVHVLSISPSFVTYANYLGCRIIYAIVKEDKPTIVEVSNMVKGAGIVAAITQKIDEKNVLKQMAPHLPNIALPRYTVTISELPKMVGGKIDFRAVTELEQDVMKRGEDGGSTDVEYAFRTLGTLSYRTTGSATRYPFLPVKRI